MDGTPVWNFLAALGMNTFLKRFVFGVLSVAILEYFFKPFWAFTEEGTLRPWAVLFPDEAGATYLPFMALPLVAGFVFTMFV